MAWTPQELFEKQRDELTNFHTTIDGDHAYIHRGRKFNATIEQDIAKNSTYKISFVSPTTISGLHANWRPALFFSSLSLLYVRVYENIASTGGSAVTPINMNRTSDKVAIAVVKKGITADVSSATPIKAYMVGSGGGPNARSGGASGAEEEIILKAQTEYIIEIVEPDTAATKLMLQLRWYEE